MQPFLPCALRDCLPAGDLRGRADAVSAWPPRSLASDLMGSRSGLDCSQPGRAECAACRFAMELPLGLIRAADAAVQEGRSDEALSLVRTAYQAAAALVPAGMAQGGAHARL